MPFTFKRDDRVVSIDDDSEIFIVVDSFIDFTFVRTFDGFSDKLPTSSLLRTQVPSAV